MLENISSKKYEPNIGTTRQASATHGIHLPLFLILHFRQLQAEALALVF